MTDASTGRSRGRRRSRRRTAPQSAASTPETEPRQPARSTATPPAADPVDGPEPTAKDFESFGLHADILAGVAGAGFLEPRPIQAATIGAAVRGRDVLGLAQTGTGKTAAFALPILDRLHREPRRGRGRRGSPRALVIAPTRELAAQILEEFRTLGSYTEVGSTVVFGGVSQGAQVRALRESPEVLVACPGRLLDLEGQGHVSLRDVEVLVLDEADHMFDMGFLPHLRRILGLLPKKRQNLLFSATMPREIRGLADEVLNRPHVVEREHSQPADTIDHALYACEQKQRLGLLEAVLDDPEFRSAIVFLRTKHRAKRVAKQLASRGHHAVALQGNMSQGARERAMKGFREGQYDVLVATDIAARGIDVAGVSHVVNFDVPNTPEAYTHRIGRTGRSERSGKAFTFASAEDRDQVRAIEKHLGQPIERRTIEGVDIGRPDIAAPAPAPERGGGRGGRGGSARGAGGPRKGGSRRGGPRAGSGRGGGRGSSGRPTGFPKPSTSQGSGGARRTERRPAADRSGFGTGI